GGDRSAGRLGQVGGSGLACESEDLPIARRGDMAELITTSGEGGGMRAFLAVLLLSGPAMAAALFGVVSDPAGQPVARSRVVIFARDHRNQITTFTDSKGRYRIEALAGEHLVQAESPGLRRSDAKA